MRTQAVCVRHAAAVVLSIAAAIDAIAATAGAFLPPALTWHMLAVAVTAGPAALLVERWSAGLRTPVTGGLRRLLGFGLALLAWWLRGHPDIPPDPPLIVACAVAAALTLCFECARSRHHDPGTRAGTASPGS